MNLIHGSHPASACLVKFDAEIHQPFALYARVSWIVQEHHKNLERQVYSALTNLPILPKAIFKEVASGRITEFRHQLHQAIAFCLDNNLTLIAEATSKFLRPEGYHPFKNPITPTEEDWQEFTKITRGVALAIIHDEEEKVQQTLRGLHGKVTIHQKIKDWARQLHGEGMSYREVAKLLKECGFCDVSYQCIKN